MHLSTGSGIVCSASYRIFAEAFHPKSDIRDPRKSRGEQSTSIGDSVSANCRARNLIQSIELSSRDRAPGSALIPVT